MGCTSSNSVVDDTKKELKQDLRNADRMSDVKIQEAASKLAENLMKKYDTNKDNQLSFKEYYPMIKDIFIAWKTNVPGEFPDGLLLDDDSVKQAFEAADMIDDDKIDMDELQAVLEKMI